MLNPLGVKYLIAIAPLWLIQRLAIFVGFFGVFHVNLPTFDRKNCDSFLFEFSREVQEQLISNGFNFWK